MDFSNIDWIYFVVIIVIIIFIIWLFLGGKNHQYIGVSPLLEQESPNISHQRSQNLSNVCSSSKFERVMSFKQLNEVNRINMEREQMLNMNGQQLEEFCKTKPKNMSKGEHHAKMVIEEIYGIPFKKIRPDWLKNPETGANLELDLFSDNIIINGTKYSVAVEYCGIQHYIYPNKFFKTEQDFKNQLRRDMYKREICDLNDVFLITVPYYVATEDMKKYILGMIPEPLLPEKYKNRSNRINIF